jgi:RNA polymerase sigma-70 factor, ECF subfamily
MSIPLPGKSLPTRRDRPDVAALPLTTDAIARRRAAFGKIAREQQAVLLSAARRFCAGNDEKAQDLVQDTLVRAYDAYLHGKFDGSSPRAWLLRILTNLFINDYRRHQKWDAGVTVEDLTRSGEAGPPQTHAADSDQPGFELLAATLDEDLERALGTLSDGLRQCVILVDMDGLDYAEAAAALGIPIGTVRSRLSRARMQLHDILRDFAIRKGLIPRRA